MRILVLAILLAFPLADLYATWQVAEWIGGTWTLLWVLTAALLGWRLLRRTPTRLVASLQSALLTGRSPLRVLAAEGGTVVAGLLLLFPGVLSDAAALPFLLAGLFLRPPGPPATAANDEILEGEYRRENEPPPPSFPRGG